VYDHLFTTEDPNEGELLENINPNSLEIITDARVEPRMRSAKPFDRFQFERLGYFCVDPDTTEDRLVFNRTVPLRDTWAKVQKS
jgi:glutaminyl-tRNA synthetase